jgi:hypothetical protein
MPGDPEEDDDDWFRPVWETEDEAEPPGPPRARQPAVEPDYGHPLLQPLARAQDAMARLETRAEAASPAVAEGLRARLSFREASGWLAHCHVWIHPHDLALRDCGVTGSYGAAFRAGRLAAEIPSTIAAVASDFEMAPSDIFVDQAVRLAWMWRRLAETHTWRPLMNTAAVLETLKLLGSGVLESAEIDDWLAVVERSSGPLLIRAGIAARDWANRPGVTPRSAVPLFLAAALWRGKGQPRSIPLPCWCAPEPRHYRLELHTGVQWMADFLDCVAAAAKIGLNELGRLQRIEVKSRSLGRTARSRLPDAVDAVLRRPIITAGDLAETLAISPQAALGLLRQLTGAGIIREATGRASWRAFSISN